MTTPSAAAEGVPCASTLKAAQDHDFTMRCTNDNAAYFSAKDSFLAGVSWRDANPSPEVLALVEALKEVKLIAENYTGLNHGAVQLRVVETVREALAAFEQARRAGE